MRAGLAHLARHGITSFHNMDGNAYTCELLSEIEAAGDLTARARVPFHFKTFMDLSALDRASELAGRFRGPMVRSGFVKLFADGVLDGFTAVMLEDYADRPGWRGEPLFEPAQLDLDLTRIGWPVFAAVRHESHDEGTDLLWHVGGDRGQWSRLPSSNRRQHREHRVTLVGKPPGNQLVEQHAEAKNVATGIERTVLETFR